MIHDIDNIIQASKIKIWFLFDLQGPTQKHFWPWIDEELWVPLSFLCILQTFEAVIAFLSGFTKITSPAISDSLSLFECAKYIFGCLSYSIFS